MKTRLDHILVNRQIAQYVSRADIRQASVTIVLKLYFKSKNLLDVGSSTEGTEEGLVV